MVSESQGVGEFRGQVLPHGSVGEPEAEFSPALPDLFQQPGLDAGVDPPGEVYRVTSHHRLQKGERQVVGRERSDPEDIPCILVHHPEPGRYDLPEAVRDHRVVGQVVDLLTRPVRGDVSGGNERGDGLPEEERIPTALRDQEFLYLFGHVGIFQGEEDHVPRLLGTQLHYVHVQQRER